MKREIKKIDATKREMFVEVFSKTFKEKFEDVYKKVSPKLKVQGFRPGNAPRDIIEKHFGQALRQQAIEEIIPEVVNKIIEDDKLEVIDTPQISDINWLNDTLSFKASFEVRPEVIVDKYKGIKIKKEKIEVSDDEVDKVIINLKEEKKLEAIDDKLAHIVGYATLADLKDALKAQLWLEKDNQRKAKIEETIINEISGNIKFTVPKTLIDKRLNELVNQAKVRLAVQGFKEADVAKQEEEFKKRLKDQAEMDVKIYLILEEIAHKENIAHDKNIGLKVLEFLYKEAVWE
ncbi:MAG: trigger factor [Candidatus Omnitrophota bacterium]